MAGKRKNQAAAIRFGPVLWVVLLCSLIGGSAVGYVSQKDDIYRLGQQIRERETRLTQLRGDNKQLRDQISILQSPVMLEQRANELNLGLVPASPMQVVRLTEMPAPAAPGGPRQFAQRPVNELTP